MISLVGGELYQWDTGRIVRVVPDENVKVHEVHFSTKRMDYAYVLKTYTVDGVTYCAIPNIILQQSNRLLCYEVCENSDGEETIANTYFDIIKRNKPEDYVYTEQEHFTIQKLSDRVDKLEESSHTHDNKNELDSITEEDLKTWRNPNSSAVTGGAQVGTLFKELEVTTTLAEDASEWTGASSQPFKCTFRPSPGQTVYAKVEGLGVPFVTIAKISPKAYPLTETIVGNYSVVNSRLKTWYNWGDSNPDTPNDTDAEWCFVFDNEDYGNDDLTPGSSMCTLYTKIPGTYKVTIATTTYSIDPESIMKMYDVRPSTVAEYGTYANWKELTKSGKYDLWEVSIKKTEYYNGVRLKEVDGTKYIYLYHSEQTEDPDSGTFTNTDYTLTYDTTTETVTCSDSTVNPETDVIISVHLDQVISTVPDNATSLGQPTSDKVGKMLTAVDRGEGAIDNKWQSRRYEYQWVDTPQADWSINDKTAPDYVKNRVGYYAEKKAAENSTDRTIDVDERVGFILTLPDDAIDLDSICGNKDHLYLYYKGKRYPLVFSSYSGGSSTYDYKTIIPEYNVFITFDLNMSSSSARGAHITFDNKTSRKITIESGDLYITTPDPVELPADLIPLAGQQTRGGIKIADLSQADGTSVYLNLDPETEKLWCTPSISGNIHTIILSVTAITNIVDRGGRTLICGSSDDTVSALNLAASNFPVTVTYVGREGTYPPTFIYLISTADGKRGRFTYAVSGQTLSPITWTFEGGGNSLFIITPTYDSDTKTYSTDRTWDEVKAAVAKSENPNDYAIVWDNSLLSPNALNVTKNSSGEITGINMHWATIYPMVIDKSVTPEGSGGIVPGADYMNIQYSAGSSSIEFTCAVSTGTLLPVIKAVIVSKSDDGTLTCNPTNTVVFCAGFLGMPDNNPQVICPLFYDGETYHYEFAEKDSSNIPSLYFSTTTNGIYKRLKITQGQDGAADTVVMDKEIKLDNSPLDVTFSGIPGHLCSNKTVEEIYDAAAAGKRVISNNMGMVLTSWDKYTFYKTGETEYYLSFATPSMRGTTSLTHALLTISTADSSSKGEWTLESESLKAILHVQNTDELHIGSILSVAGIINDSISLLKAVDVLTTTNTTAFTPTADYHPATKKFVEDSIKAIPVDGTTIKLNEQGQLTLALSNANGVSF